MKLTFNYPKPCVNCGKPAKKKTESYYGTEPYKNFLPIQRDKSWRDGNGLVRYQLSLWDGESYTHYCGNFCTNKCAINYANQVVEFPYAFLPDFQEPTP